MKRKIIPKLYTEDLVKYESLNDNMLRSTALCYSNGIMRKDKYRAMCKASSNNHVPEKKHVVHINIANCPIPKLVPCRRLMLHIKSIDISKLHSVLEELCDG